MRRKMHISAVDATTAPGGMDTLIPTIRILCGRYTFSSTGFSINLVISGAVMTDIFQGIGVMRNQLLINESGHLNISSARPRDKPPRSQKYGRLRPHYYTSPSNP